MRGHAGTWALGMSRVHGWSHAMPERCWACGGGRAREFLAGVIRRQSMLLRPPDAGSLSTGGAPMHVTVQLWHTMG